jgi:hypothetical protein
VQRAVEGKIKQTIRFNALGQGARATYLIVQCIPESSTKLSCIVNATIAGQLLTATWEGIVDPDTGKFNV